MRDPKYNTLVPYAFVAMRCPVCAAPRLVVDGADSLGCEACGRVFDGLATVPDLAPALADRVGVLRALARTDRLGRWMRRVGRPAVDRWARGRSDDTSAWLTRWLRPTDGPVLDLCTGAGGTARAVGRWMGAGRVIGVDHDLRLLRQTQGSSLDPGLAYVRARDAALPFRDGAVGAVTAMAGLHQAADPLALVGEVGRVLGPGGTFVGAVHVDEGPIATRWSLRALGEPPVPRQAFADAVDRAGMALVSLQRAGVTAWFAARRRALSRTAAS